MPHAACGQRVHWPLRTLALQHTVGCVCACGSRHSSLQRRCRAVRARTGAAAHLSEAVHHTQFWNEQ
eukprot:5797507-Prymnesium_polylepis.1